MAGKGDGVRTWLARRAECDFCGKRNSSPGHMARHEKHCLRNPDRVCRMCNALGLSQQPMGLLKEALGQADEEGIANIKALTECPICISAAILQTGGYHRPTGEVHRELIDAYSNHWDEWSLERTVPFDYKAELEAAWASANAEEWRREEARAYYGL